MLKIVQAFLTKQKMEQALHGRVVETRNKAEWSLLPREGGLCGLEPLLVPPAGNLPIAENSVETNHEEAL